jgi:lysozyme
LIRKSPCDGTEPAEFLGGITKPRGEELLRNDLEKAEVAAQILLDGPLTDGQYGSVVDFIYNVGVGNFQRSTLRQVINDGAPYDQVPFELRRWVLADGKTWSGLQRRREREIALFFEGSRAPEVDAQPPIGLDLINIRGGERQR